MNDKLMVLLDILEWLWGFIPAWVGRFFSKPIKNPLILFLGINLLVVLQSVALGVTVESLQFIKFVLHLNIIALYYFFLLPIFAAAVGIVVIWVVAVAIASVLAEDINAGY